MASTNKLPNSDLNQWLETDKPEMEDFNRDNRIVDGLVGHLKRTPYIGANGNWFVWNTISGEYVDTEKRSYGEVGPRGPQGEIGETGPQGLQGLQGIQGVKGDTGEIGPVGPKGERGEKGDTGAGFQMKGLFESLAALQAAHPTGYPGDAYAVGTAAANDVYIWSPETNTWANIGNLQGPQGLKGDTGDAGAQGPHGINGEKGDPGEKGETGPQGLPAKVNGISPNADGEIVWMPTATQVGAATENHIHLWHAITEKPEKFTPAYDSGEWTPIIEGGIYQNGTVKGTYSRIANIVILTGSLTLTDWVGDTSVLSIAGLPFPIFPDATFFVSGRIKSATPFAANSVDNYCMDITFDIAGNKITPRYHHINGNTYV